MYKAIARPRLRISENISAYTPPETVCGAAAMVPQMRRKINKAVQFGATVQPSVPRTKTLKVQKRTGLLPTVSLKGLHTKGPTQYPIRKIAVGKTFWPSPDRPKFCMIVGTALLGREDDTPLFSTMTSPTTALYIFFFCYSCQFLRLFDRFKFLEDQLTKSSWWGLPLNLLRTRPKFLEASNQQVCSLRLS